MIATTSSSFSVIAMARFPSLGTMIPVTKAPVKELALAQPGMNTRPTEDRMDADNIGKERRSKHK